MGKTLKELKDLSFIEEVKLTADEYRDNVTMNLINNYIVIMRSKHYVVDDKLSELISNVFKYVIKKRKVIKSVGTLYQNRKHDINDLRIYVNKTLKYELQKPTCETRQQYLHWVHEIMSNGKSRKENIEFIWYIVLYNKKWNDIIYQLNNVRKYMND